MPEEQKRGFVLYFSNYDSVAGLTMAQRGELFSALYEYARAAAADPAAEQGAVLAAHPAMDLETRMAFSFMAETVRRDTEKWWEKHRRYQAAARRRREASLEAGDGEPQRRPRPHAAEGSAARDAWAYVSRDGGALTEAEAGDR